MGRWAHDTDIDRVVVDRLIAGIPVQAAPWERCAAVRRLREQGHSYSQIAARLGVAERQVARDLARCGLVDETVRPRRVRSALERRRRSVPLLAAGWRNRDVARLLGVSPWLISKDRMWLSTVTATDQQQVAS